MLTEEKPWADCGLVGDRLFNNKLAKGELRTKSCNVIYPKVDCKQNSAMILGQR